MYDLYIYIAIVIIFFLLGLIIGLIQNPKRKLRKHKELPLSETAKNLGLVIDIDKNINNEQRYSYSDQREININPERDKPCKEHKDPDKRRKCYEEQDDLYRETPDYSRRWDDFDREQYDLGRERNSYEREQGSIDRDRSNVDTGIRDPEFEPNDSDRRNRSDSIRYGFNEYHKGSQVDYDNYRPIRHSHKSSRIL
jgi:hypothetical protein